MSILAIEEIGEVVYGSLKLIHDPTHCVSDLILVFRV